MNNITPTTLFSCFAGPIGFGTNAVLSTCPIEPVTKKTFVEEGTSILSLDKSPLKTPCLQSCIGLAVVMTTGERFLAHFDNEWAVSPTIKKNIERITSANPEAKVSKIVVCGGDDEAITALACATQTGKYMSMGLAASYCSTPVCITSSLALYLCCTTGAPGQEVCDTSVRDTVVREAKKLSQNYESATLDIRPANKDKTYALSINSAGTIDVREDLGNIKEYYDHLDADRASINEEPTVSSINQLMLIKRPIIQHQISRSIHSHED